MGLDLHVDYIFAPERMLVCITSNGLSVLVFLLTDLLFGIPSSPDQFLNTAQLRKYQLEEISDRSDWGDPWRAIHIIYPVTMSMPWYWVALQYAELPSLSDRRDKLWGDFFLQIAPSNCIHRLLPPTRDTDITSRLRKANTYPRPRNRTNCYKSFIHHAFLKYGVRSKRPRTKTAADWNGRRPIRPRDKTGAWTDLSI